MFVSYEVKEAALKRVSVMWAAVLSCAIWQLALPVVAQVNHADSAHSWTYSGENGPQHWGDLSPEFTACASGKKQSPIDIEHADPSHLPAIEFAYHPSPLKIIDNGHTIQINYAPGSTITIGKETYELAQFHFHHPSEEEINGKRYAMVAHLVHRNKEGKLAVVAVLVKEGGANQLISTLWNNLPREKSKELDLNNVKVNVADLLPSDHKYYTFAGSLTTPPCSEGVTWYVLESPISLSKAQVDKFMKVYPHNARPVQPLNGRVVQKSE